MSDQNCIYCGELVNYSSEPEFGETGDETPNGPAHHRCIAKARIEELEAEVKHFRTKATRFETEAESGWHLASDAARGLGVECDGDLGHEAEQIRKERDQLRKALWNVYKEDQHPNYDDPTSPIIGSLGKMAWKVLNRTENGGNV